MLPEIQGLNAQIADIEKSIATIVANDEASDGADRWPIINAQITNIKTK